MLVLTRKVGERIVIGENITVTVVEIQKGRVRLAVSAPREISIHREEVVLGAGGSQRNLECAASV